MTIRIDRIERRDQDSHYAWFITMKGLHGQGVYCYLQTGEDGHGLSYSEHGFGEWRTPCCGSLPCPRGPERGAGRASRRCVPRVHRVGARVLR